MLNGKLVAIHVVVAACALAGCDKKNDAPVEPDGAIAEGSSAETSTDSAEQAETTAGDEATKGMELPASQWSYNNSMYEGKVTVLAVENDTFLVGTSPGVEAGAWFPGRDFEGATEVATAGLSDSVKSQIEAVKKERALLKEKFMPEANVAVEKCAPMSVFDEVSDTLADQGVPNVRLLADHEGEVAAIPMNSSKHIELEAPSVFVEVTDAGIVVKVEGEMVPEVPGCEGTGVTLCAPEESPACAAPYDWEALADAVGPEFDDLEAKKVYHVTMPANLPAQTYVSLVTTLRGSADGKWLKVPVFLVKE